MTICIVWYYGIHPQEAIFFTAESYIYVIAADTTTKITSEEMETFPNYIHGHKK